MVMLNNPLPLGIKIIVSDHCLKDTDERTFPISRNRSQRIHKKLLKRYGGEFRRVPAMYHMADAIVCHPAIYGELQGRAHLR